MPSHMSERDGGRTLELVVTGKVTDGDLERFQRELEALAERHGSVRLLLEMVDVHGLDVSALFADTEFKLVPHIERVAVVGEKAWERRLTALAGALAPAAVQYFDRTSIADARAWLAAA